ncbi:zf-CCHC domain-containing protein/Asp_protease_2 domain-containing protein, partial [Cephalotus follicularis]
KRCYKCQGLGHFAVDCPNQSIITLVVEESEPKFDESDEKQSELSENGEIIYAGQGESLVLHRILNVAVSDEDQWLRNNIFHTKCTSKGKTCNVIIDGGSCKNVVSETMVEKLGLKTEKHPRPYKLLRFRKGNEVKVDKRCLVQFSIGQKYHDELWCDVVPMGARHMLLGRPGQYDRRTKHDGFKNTYTFKKDRVTIILGSTDTKKILRRWTIAYCPNRPLRKQWKNHVWPLH